VNICGAYTGQAAGWRTETADGEPKIVQICHCPKLPCFLVEIKLQDRLGPHHGTGWGPAAYLG
jgi:hypothetical protein